MSIYSLLCFKGRVGAVATMSVASPCVVTLTAHGVWNGLGVVFSTTGALPTGVTAATTYYARYVGADTFHLYDTEAHALDTTSTVGRINTSGAQSGVHTIWSSYWYNLPADDRLNYGAAGSERVYAGFTEWKTARSAAASPVETEVFEIADPIRDTIASYDTTGINYAAFPAYGITITTIVNGTRSKAFHFGKVAQGYFWYCTIGYNPIIFFDRANVTIDGIRWLMTGSQVNPLYMRFGAGCRVCNNIGSAPAGFGMVCAANFAQIYNNIMHGCQYSGFRFIAYQVIFTKVYNNLSVKNGVGFEQYSSPGYGNFFNNVAYGNVTNWTSPPSAPNEGGMKRNCGATGDTPWGAEAITGVTTADFVDYANNDFRIVSGSILKDAGITLIDGDLTDILGALRPNYSAGTATDAVDCGPFEYDSGNGDPPITITVDGMASGSIIRASRVDTGAVIYSGVGPSFPTGYMGATKIEVRCASSAPFYRPWQTQVTPTVGVGMTVTALQESDEE